MNRDRLNWGLVLLFIGIMWLLSNTGVISFYWSSLWRFWPVFLIILGVNLLLPRHGIGNAASVVATIAALVFIGYQASKPSNRWNFGLHMQYDTDDDDDAYEDSTAGPKNTDFSSPYLPSIKQANLEIKGGAVAYKMKGTTADLFSAKTKGVFAGHVLETTTKDSTADLSFRMRKTKKEKWDLKNGENEVFLSLNEQPLWNIQVDVGAGAVEFDLSKYKVTHLQLKGGAASFETKLGMPVGETAINVESGVANIEIEIPKEAAGQIVVKSGLSSKEFPGFTKQSDDTYVTENFDQAKEKFLINLKGGLSSFSVKRY